jgi:hypothetical protein
MFRCTSHTTLQLCQCVDICNDNVTCMSTILTLVKKSNSNDKRGTMLKILQNTYQMYFYVEMLYGIDNSLMMSISNESIHAFCFDNVSFIDIVKCTSPLALEIWKTDMLVLFNKYSPSIKSSIIEVQ